ncbi:MAG: hypothetical protein JWQ49_5401 [Edaphobacter sp.]|nr:hypothetical protein [Edaphobacter sp.]
MLYQPVASQPLLHAISSNPAAISTGHSYVVLCRSIRDASIAQSKLLIIIKSHSRSVFLVDTEMHLLPFRFFVAHQPEASCSGEDFIGRFSRFDHIVFDVNAIVLR